MESESGVPVTPIRNMPFFNNPPTTKKLVSRVILDVIFNLTVCFVKQLLVIFSIDLAYFVNVKLSGKPATPFTRDINASNTYTTGYLYLLEY